MGRPRPSARPAALAGGGARTRRSRPGARALHRAPAAGHVVHPVVPAVVGHRLARPVPVQRSSPRPTARPAATGRSARRSCRTRPRLGRPARRRRSPGPRSGCPASPPAERSAAAAPRDRRDQRAQLIRDVASAAAVRSIHGSPKAAAVALVVHDVIPDEQRVPAGPLGRRRPPRHGLAHRRSRRSSDADIELAERAASRRALHLPRRAPLSRMAGELGVGSGLRQRRREGALHRVESLGALVCSARDEGALESCEEHAGVVLCG